jgi:hypothetical protein
MPHVVLNHLQLLTIYNLQKMPIPANTQCFQRLRRIEMKNIQADCILLKFSIPLPRTELHSPCAAVVS